MQYSDTLWCMLVIVFAATTGLMFSVRICPPFRWAGRVAGLLIVGVVVVAGVAIKGEPAWCGPLFSILTLAASVMVEAAARRDEPSFVVLSYWRRVLFVLSRGLGRSDVR